MSRAYQQDFVDKGLPDAWRAGHRSVFLAIPVSGGKTRCSRLVAERLLSKPGWDVWYLAHRRELVEQPAREFAHLDPAVFLAGLPPPKPKPLRIAGRDTLLRREITPINDKCFLIIDEGHRSVGDGYMKLYARFRERYRVVYVLLTSATPYRLDGRPLGAIANTLVEPTTPRQLMDAGIIHEPLIKSVATIDADGLPVRRGDFLSTELEVRAKKISGNVVSEWLRWCGGYPGVVRAVSVAHSKQLVERFTTAGLRAAHLDGETPLAERSRILARLAIGGQIAGNAEGIDVLCQVDVASEGWNPPSDYERSLALWGDKTPPYVPICILSDARPTMSACGYRQFEGRGCRTSGAVLETSLGPRPALPKPWFRFLDHAKNYERHRFLEEHFGFALDEGAPTSRAPRDKRGLVSARYCPQCLSVWPGGRTVCACGAALSQPKIAEETGEALDDVRRVVDVSAPAKAQELLTNLYRSVLRKRGADLNERQVAAIYHSMTKKWPSKEAMSEARRRCASDGE